MGVFFLKKAFFQIKEAMSGNMTALPKLGNMSMGLLIVCK